MSGEALVKLAAFGAASYAIGSIPFGVLIARAHGVDLRSRGSGNVGATNVGRLLGRRWGYLCFVLDVLKGFVPVLLVGLHVAGRSGGPPTVADQAVWVAAATGCILGHVFSAFLRFRGGKGVATSLGVLLGIYPYFTWAGLAALVVWAAVVKVSRYVSLGSIVAATAFPLLFAGACALQEGWSIGRLWPLLAFAVAMAALVILRHRGNIARLLAGSENKIGRARGS